MIKIRSRSIWKSQVFADNKLGVLDGRLIPCELSDTNHHLHISPLTASCPHPSETSSLTPVLQTPPPPVHNDRGKLPRVRYSYHKIVFELQMCLLL